MKLEYRGQYFYLYSGPAYAQTLGAEEWIGFWRNLDDTKRTEIVLKKTIVNLQLYPELFEVHLYFEGRSSPRRFKLLNERDFDQFVEILQAGLQF